MLKASIAKESIILVHQEKKKISNEEKAKQKEYCKVVK